MKPANSPRQERRAKRIARRFLGELPFAVGITGGARDRLLSVMDRVFSYHDGQAETERVITSDGRHFEVRLDSPNERLLSYFYGNLLRHYKRSQLYDFMCRKSAAEKVPGTFLDVGANLGFYCILARDLGFETIAVEAEPGHREYLERQGDLIGHIWGVAAGDREGRADFFVARRDNPGASSLVVDEGALEDSSIYDGRVEVPVRRLDDLLAQGVEDGSSIGLIKIDVEGHEAAAVRGLTGFFDEGHRPAIWCEVRGPQSGRGPSSYRDVSEVLFEYGYEAFRYDGGPVPFEPESSELPQVFDLLFI